jgi:hypothetical protein
MLKEEKSNQNEGKKTPKDIKYWIYRGLGIASGIIMIITLFLPWYQAILTGLNLSISPILIDINGYIVPFWGYMNLLGIYDEFIPFLAIMNINFTLIIVSIIFSFLKITRAPSSLLMVVIILSFIGIGATSLFSVFDSGLFFPFFGFYGSQIWGFSGGWILLFLALFLTLFSRIRVPSEKEKFKREFKQKIKEMQD